MCVCVCVRMCRCARVCVCVCWQCMHACSACSHGEVGSAVLEERTEGGEEVLSPWMRCGEVERGV